MDDQDMISPEEMAAMHGVQLTTIYRILRADQKRPPEAQKIPGAQRVGDKWRGSWLIPRASAQAWKNAKQGRPRKS